MANYNNTISDEIIAFLFSYRSTSIRRKILWEHVKERNNISRRVYNQNIYRLKKKRFIHSNNDDFIISDKGVAYYKNPYRQIKRSFDKKTRVILIFDIPESKRNVRNWIRNQIKFWDFEMIQKSVWVGHGPLPPEFSNRLKLLEVEKCVRVFNIKSKN